MAFGQEVPGVKKVEANHDENKQKEQEKIDKASVHSAADGVKTLEEAPERAQQVAQPFDRRGSGRRRCDGLTDEQWSQENLRRCEEDYLILDLANVLRILERHPEFSGRYLYDVNMHKVIDRGVVMVVWQVDALAAELQERFLPGVGPEMVHKAIDIVANKSAIGARV